MHPSRSLSCHLPQSSVGASPPGFIAPACSRRPFWHDLLRAGEEDLDDRLRAVATSTLHLPREVEAALDAERKYRAAMKHWDAYRTWAASRNPARAELERRHGYDTKHAMHLVRLMRTGLEVLETGDLRVRRPDAEGLIAIRDGALTFDQLLGLASELQVRMEVAAARTSLPPDVDLDFVDGLALEMVRGTHDGHPVVDPKPRLSDEPGPRAQQ